MSKAIVTSLARRSQQPAHGSSPPPGGRQQVVVDPRFDHVLERHSDIADDVFESGPRRSSTDAVPDLLGKLEQGAEWPSRDQMELDVEPFVRTGAQRVTPARISASVFGGPQLLCPRDAAGHLRQALGGVQGKATEPERGELGRTVGGKSAKAWGVGTRYSTRGCSAEVSSPGK